MKLGEHHLIVLKALYDLHEDNPEWLWTFKRIQQRCAHNGHEMMFSQVRKIVRFLKRKELAFYSQAFTEELLTAGSGHCISAYGEEILKEYQKQNPEFL